jgi:hypothetical protein
MPTAAQRQKSGLRFSDPGAPQRGGPGAVEGVWIDRLSPLVSFPGEWVIVHTVETSTKAAACAANLNHGRVKLPPGRWVAASRVAYDVDGNPSYNIHAKYLGPES